MAAAEGQNIPEIAEPGGAGFGGETGAVERPGGAGDLQALVAELFAGTLNGTGADLEAAAAEIGIAHALRWAWK